MSQLALNICRGLFSSFSSHRIAKVVIQTHYQENDPYFKDLFLISQIDKSKFSEDEKYIDSSSLDDLATQIQQDIERGMDFKKIRQDSSDKITILLYLPEDRSYQQTVEGLKNGSKLIKKTVQFVYFGKVSGPDVYGHFTNEISGDHSGANKASNPNAKTLVKPLKKDQSGR